MRISISGLKNKWEKYSYKNDIFLMLSSINLGKWEVFKTHHVSKRKMFYEKGKFLEHFYRKK